MKVTKPIRFKNIKVNKDCFYGTELHGRDDFEVRFSANWTLFLIREAWHRGLNLEREADGYGKGLGTHGDWSGIRDSSSEATEVMLEKSLNFLFPRREC